MTDKSTGTQLLDRAIAILDALGQAGHEGAKVGQLAKTIGLTMSTTHRIVASLERHGLIAKEESTKRYRLGLTFFVLGSRAADASGLRKIGHPSVLNIAAKTGDTAFLMAHNGFNAVCIDRQQGNYVIDSLSGGVGGQIPLGVGPASQAILAHLDSESIDAVLKANTSIYRRYAGLSSTKIRSRLSDIRDQGYAIDDGELVDGISALSVAIRPEGYEVTGSLAVNMTSARLTKKRQVELIELLNQEARKIEARINPLDTIVSTRG